MRLYCFSNMYWTHIHAGIQSLHSLGELIVKYSYDPRDEAWVQIQEWAARSKVAIVVNGGYAESLRGVIAELTAINKSIVVPFAPFYESREAADGCLTNVGVIVSANIVEYNDAVREAVRIAGTDVQTIREAIQAEYKLVAAEIKLAELVSRFPLAH